MGRGVLSLWNMEPWLNRSSLPVTPVSSHCPMVQMLKQTVALALEIAPPVPRGGASDLKTNKSPGGNLLGLSAALGRVDSFPFPWS